MEGVFVFDSKKILSSRLPPFTIYQMQVTLLQYVGTKMYFQKSGEVGIGQDSTAQRLALCQFYFFPFPIRPYFLYFFSCIFPVCTKVDKNETA